MEQENLTAESESNNSFLQDQLLIAMPNLGDPYFERSVTLICQHNKDGCFGLTVNRPTQVSIEELFDQLEIPTINKHINGMFALQGGPIQAEQGFIVHDGDKQWENTIAINSIVSVTASRDILFDIAQDKGPDNFQLILGCASWAPGQMESEIMQNSWLNCDVDNKILFDTPYDKRWHSAVDILGVDVNFISSVAGHD